MPVSIEDVAKKANVSISTVSRVVNRRDIVNEKTRARVESAIRELGYRPNAFARGLMLRRSNILTLVLPDLHGEFYSEMIRGANSKARELGYQLMVSSVFQHDEHSDLLSTISNHSLVDGMAVMVSEIDAKAMRELVNVSIPLVILDNDIKGVSHDTVEIDQRHGAAEMAEHLIEARGARQIVFVGGHDTNYDTIERLSALRDVMSDAGLSLDDEDVFFLDYRYETAYQLAVGQVKRWADAGAFVWGANDEMAAGIIDAAIEMGVSVPRDLPVVGFDDTRIALMTRPRLTTVHVPMSQMGSTAIELLVNRLADPERTDAKVTLRSQLVIRDSCGSTLAAPAQRSG
ncbi:LacI family DNA-binding transcriptional regulator [Pirellulales bacterium]|nr:LacI family DNA-binding transcriptional regulator [Pirellulales bacterium]